MTKALTPAGERILTVASALFYERGIRAVGVDLIADEAGTTKKTLYDRFGSKDGLVMRYLERRYETWCAFVLDFLDAYEPGPTRVLGVYDALEAWMRDNHRGCGFVNAFAEYGGTDHPSLEVIRSEKDWTRALFVRLATEAGMASPDDLGLRLSLLHEGAVVMSTAGQRDDAIEVARDVASRLVSGNV
ncbi:TetR/AcrR family transcriptional regulator [Rhodococcoides kyotonense]|uniref:DNA-binding transcriptional regulator, AcrR family n=1 Tax=Rhodococcoides kyotonense TaxID=398843 RepID=A0A239ER25_9NOCA|nr:TetR/AcrR family transcriptional regulator [Rhodococcus kyotonensis]SNS46483.1 DNA-binding transcriptional regulator, AcrR family [Rhodococcus kyotonensis]